MPHSSFLILKTLILTWVSALVTSSKPNHFPKAPPPNAIPLGDWLQCLNLGGTQTFIAESLRLLRVLDGKDGGGEAGGSGTIQVRGWWPP